MSDSDEHRSELLRDLDAKDATIAAQDRVINTAWAAVRDGLDDAYREHKWDLAGAIRHRIAAQAEQIALLEQQWERECADADKVLIGLGCTVEIGRTEGGSLHLGKILARCADLAEARRKLAAALEHFAHYEDNPLVGHGMAHILKADPPAKEPS